LNIFTSSLFGNALLAGSVVAVVAGIVGYFVVIRAQVFAGEALKDIGFAGATGAAVIGMQAIFGMLALSLAAALAIGFLSHRVRGRDIEVGMVLSFALGIGVLFLSLYAHSSGTHASSGVTILFGSILSITRSDIFVAVVGGLASCIAVGFLFRPLLFASVDPVVAEARGVPVRALSLIFMIIIAVTVASSVLVLGVLLVAALLIAPPAAAVNVTRNPASAVLISVVIALVSTWIGLFFSFRPGVGNLPVGFTISATTALAYFLSFLIRRRSLARRIPTTGRHLDREVNPS
jgi:zinc/manganese transport system permease protein